MFKKNYFAVVSLLFLCFNPASLSAGTITGPIQLASSGKGFPNGTLTFTLTQAAVVSGTATIVTSPVNCYTDGLGNVVGLPNPLALPVLSSVNGGGTLPPGNYFVRTTWANSSGETVPGPERSINITQPGQLVVQVPANPLANATQWKIYISATTGTETLQATQTAPFTSNYSQTSPLVTGAAMPGSNNTTCSLRFNDELQPSFTGYNVTFTTATGAIVPGFPQKWYLSGGSTGIINVGSGLPLYNGTVVYPQPIISNPAQSATQSINGPLNMNGFKLTDSNINGFFYVDGTTFTTIQQAITAACAVGGGTVYVPSGTYPQNSPFTLCSNLNLLGAGRGDATGSGCVTTITTTLASGDLFPITNMKAIHLSDFCINNIGSAGANAAIRLNFGQFVVVERLFINGPFAVALELDSSSASSGSTIRNTFRDIFDTNLAPNGIGCLLNSSDATSKVINGNTFSTVACQGGSSGANAAGIKLTNTNQAQIINENWFFCDEVATVNTAGGGTGVLITQGATADTVFVGCNIENNLTGFNKAAANTVIFIGGGIQSNGTNVTDTQPIFTTFMNTRIGGVVQTFAITPIGGGYFDGLGVGGAPPQGNSVNWNGSGGFGCLSLSSTCKWQLQTSALAPNSAAGSSIGTQTLPASDIFIGGSANHVLDFDTSALTTNRQIKAQDASGTLGFTSGTQRFFAGCNGTASPSTTITMPWPGTATTACTNTISTIQIPATSVGTAKNMRVRCGTAGAGAASGVFTLIQNGANSALTCTVGTGQTCSDATHSVSLAAGDLLLIQFTTQAAETLANCAVSFEIQ
jgi:hypothetical protein